MSAEDAAGAVTDPAARQRLRELMVLLELYRHPLSEAQVSQVDEYAAALGESGPGLQIARDLVRQSADIAQADYARFLAGRAEELAEPSLRGEYLLGDFTAPDHELATRLRPCTTCRKARWVTSTWSSTVATGSRCPATIRTSP